MLQRAFLCIVLELFFFTGYGQVVSDFNSNADGWTVFDRAVGATSAVVYNNTGGNPGGDISFNTASANAQFYFNAPPKFIGNLSFSYNQNLSFDLQQSATGNDNSVGDVILANSAAGASIFFQLAAKPAIGSWSSYSAPLKETAGWHYGSPVGPAPTKDQMKQVLVNVTTFQIRLKYSTAAGAYTGLLDNVVLNVAALGTPPTISSFTPTSALKGTSVTINGTNFNTAASQNAVYFNGVQASVTSASATQLVVKVPVSAPYGPITVADISTGLQGVSKQSFNLLFDNNKDYGGRIIPASMTRGYATLLPMSNNINTFGAIDKADFDGDGWVDLVVTETGTQTIFVSRNLGTGGVVSIASFGALTALPSLSGVPGGSPSLSRLLVADFDSDGKLDVAALCQGASYEYFALFKNTTSAPGTISFSAPQFFPIPNYNAYTLAASDLDGDGRIDLLATSGTVPSNLWIGQNISSPGNIDFAFGKTFGANSGFTSIATCDLDGDLKPEVVMGNANGKTFSVLKNTSIPGTISLAPSFIVTPDVSTASDPIMRIMDLDNDGKLDLAWSTSGASTVYLKQNVYSGGAFDATAFSADIPIASHLSSPLDLSGIRHQFRWENGSCGGWSYGYFNFSKCRINRGALC